MSPNGFTPRGPFAYKIPSWRSPPKVERAREPRDSTQETVEETGQPRPRNICRFRHFLIEIVDVLRHRRRGRRGNRPSRPLVVGLGRPPSGATRPVSGAHPPLQVPFCEVVDFVVHVVVGMAPDPHHCDSPTLFPQLIQRPPDQPVSNRIRVKASDTRRCARNVLVVDPKDEETPLGRISMNHQPAQDF